MNEQRLYNILLASYTTEKSVKLAEGYKQITFKVAKDASKIEVKQAVEKLFNVIVTAVRIINIKGKARQFKQRKGQCAGFKKALVFLEKGHDINLAEFE